VGRWFAFDLLLSKGSFASSSRKCVRFERVPFTRYWHIGDNPTIGSKTCMTSSLADTRQGVLSNAGASLAARTADRRGRLRSLY
jgi:hypothetical protein